MKREQNHFLDLSKPNDCIEPHNGSCYRYLELGGKEHQGQRPVGYTGMVWSSHRPSDDQQQFGYLVPSNCFAVMVLSGLVDIATKVLKDNDMAEVAKKLRGEILEGIRDHGIITNEHGKKTLAYEVDGLGNVNRMDDANVPSLMSLPYFGFGGVDVERVLETDVNELLLNTRQVVLSKLNPFYFEGQYARGVGSPHTPKGHVWHMSLSMQGLSIDKPFGNEKELCEIFLSMQRTDAGTNFTHESFHVGNPKQFTRKWFAWSNSLFAELILKHLDWLTGGGREGVPCNTTPLTKGKR